MRNLALVILSLAILSFFACRKTLGIGEEPSSTIPELEYKNWLNRNGQSFASGTVSIYFGNRLANGILKWESAVTYSSAGYEFVVVPFVFDISPFKSKRVISPSLTDGSPTLYHMVFFKDSNGKIDARFRHRAFHFAAGGGKRNIIESYYKLTGTVQSVRLLEDGLAPVYGEKASNSASGRITECSQPITVVSHTTQCAGTTMDDVKCWSVAISTIYRFCTSDATGNPGETPESLDPDHNDYSAGWVEIESQTTQFENQSIIDSLQGYPCAQDILREMPSCTDEVQNILDSIFGAIEDVRLVYKPELSLTRDSLTNAYTLDPDTLTSNIYYQRIMMNAWVLQNSSREYIASTMLHEAIHSYISYWEGQYRMGRIDSNTFKARFPIFWDPSRPRSDGEMQDHEEMAVNFTSMFKRFILSFNSNMSDAMATALAWKGLQGTSVWKVRSDTNSLKDLGRIARRDLDSTSYASYNLRKCP
jgi:hypothetical protein